MDRQKDQLNIQQSSQESFQGSAKDIQIRMPGDEYVSFSEKALKDCNEYYPDCDKNMYRVPPVNIKSRTVRKQTDDKYNILKERNVENDKGEEAVSVVCNSLEDLKYILCEQTMFLISNYIFQNYLNEIRTEMFDGNNIFAQETGEHDILLLLPEHGVVFIQVKAIEECESGRTKKQRDNRNKMIKERVEKGLEQLDRDVKVFSHIMKDLSLKLSITKVLALPNISKKYISKLTATVSKLKASLGENALNICLFRDHINTDGLNSTEIKSSQENLLKWWECNINAKSGFDNATEYKQVIGRYVGLMSTVKIRTLGDAVAEEGYQNMRIILTPEQLEIVHSNDPKVYIQGSFGTGKQLS